MNKSILFLIILVLLVSCSRYSENPPYPYNLSLCKGSADCFVGAVEKIYDGDTLSVDGITIRLALTDAPEKNEEGFFEAIDLSENLCPLDSHVLVDEDDGQADGSYGRMVAVVYCKEHNLNEQLLESGHTQITWKEYCNASEFGNESWARRGGC
ncbi:MAG: thermonuclease family protein [bacterium]|nr:thermonuclease family protein [bacterium]